MVSNTLLFTNLPSQELEFNQANDLLLNSLVPIAVPAHWCLLRSFRRIMAVFDSAKTGVLIRKNLENKFSSDRPAALKDLKMFYGDNTPVSVDATHLQLPDAGRLWLLSPPPSPPVGWESKDECEPNKDTHFDFVDLQSALHRKGLVLDPACVASTAHSPPNSDHSKHSKTAVIHEGRPDLKLDTSQVDTEDGPLSTPSIVVEWEDDDMSDHDEHRALPRTEMPPVFS